MSVGAPAAVPGGLSLLGLRDVVGRGRLSRDHQGTRLRRRRDLGVDEPLPGARNVILGMWLPATVPLRLHYAHRRRLPGLKLRPELRHDRRSRRWGPRQSQIIFASASPWRSTTPTWPTRSVGYVLALLFATQLVGWGEEGMFRGIGVTTLQRARPDRGQGRPLVERHVRRRAHHATPWATATWAASLPQAIAVGFRRLSFYLTRQCQRRQRPVPIPFIHGLLDFSILGGPRSLAERAGGWDRRRRSWRRRRRRPPHGQASPHGAEPAHTVQG